MSQQNDFFETFKSTLPNLKVKRLERRNRLFISCEQNIQNLWGIFLQSALIDLECDSLTTFLSAKHS